MRNGIKFHQQCVKRLLSEYEKISTQHSKDEVIFDDERQRYIVMNLGWSGERRIHFCLVHIDIREGNIIIQANNTEDFVASRLVEMGVPAERIFLSFLPPEYQAFARHPEYLALQPAQ